MFIKVKEILISKVFPRKDVRRIFLERENFFYEGNIAIPVFVILFLTFTISILGLGTLDFLEYRMGNPYVKSIDIEVPILNHEEIRELKDSLQLSKEFNEYFEIDTISGYNEFALSVRDINLGESFTRYGRTIESWDPLLKVVIEKSIYRNLEIDLEKIKESGIIVSKRFIDEFNYDLPFNKGGKIPRIAVQETGESGITTILTIPIMGVAEKLPSSSQFLGFPNFFKKRIHLMSEYDFVTKAEFLISKEDESLIDAITEEIRENGYEIKRIKRKEDELFQNFIHIEIRLEIEIELFELLTIINKIKQESGVKDHVYHLKSYNPDSYSLEKIDKPGFISFHLSDLNKTRLLADTLSKTDGVIIDTKEIESKELLDRFNVLSKFLGILLIALSVTSLVFFSKKVFRAHFETIKKSIGTLKAFGISKREVINIYLNIFGIFYAIVGITSTLLSIVIIKIVISIGNAANIDFLNHLSPFRGELFLILIFVFSSGLVPIRNTLKKEFNKTPGELVYGIDQCKKL